MEVSKLDLLPFTDAYNKVIQFIKSEKLLTFQELKDVLKLKEKELVSTFLEKYEEFDREQLKLVESYINENLDNEDANFLSDLIDFSSIWGLNLDYEKLLEKLKDDSKEKRYVVLSSVQYFTENIKLFYVSELVKSLENILENSNYYQNAQIATALCLFRITHKKKYLSEVKDWFVDNETNSEYLKNTLKAKFYKKKYFFRTAIKEVLVMTSTNK